MKICGKELEARTALEDRSKGKGRKVESSREIRDRYAKRERIQEKLELVE